MHDVMAGSTQRDQIFFGIVARLATKFFVMNLEVGPGAARLAPPPVATQHLLAEMVVVLRIEPQPRLLWPDPLHATFSATESKNTFLSSPGRNWKNRSADCKRISGFSLSRFAPARKSAQIISRQ
jgi:hypothetical protein